MSLTFHWIPVRHGEHAQAELNRALRTLRVLSVEKHFCPNPGDPGWAVCIEHVEARSGEAPARDGSGKAVDYRAVLDSATFTVYAALRSLRKEIAYLGFPLAAAHPPESLAADPAFEASGFVPARFWPLRVLVGAWRRARTLPESLFDVQPRPTTNAGFLRCSAPPGNL